MLLRYRHFVNFFLNDHNDNMNKYDEANEKYYANW